jgi:oligosaccharide repeat unit polymerase
MSSLITGERDIFFCYILATIMVLINFSKINKSQILLLVVCALFLIPISSRYKNILYINDDDKVSKSAELPIIAQIFFSGEFLAGGRNLETILQYEEPKRYGMSLINDITRAIIPPFIVQVENSVGWFAYKYHYNLVRIGQGLGFSIIAEGYLNFGFAGIFLWFTVISIIIIVLHNKTGNQYVLLLYVFMIPNFIYAIRGDFSTILSPMVKQIIIPIIFLKIISYIYYETIISNRRS